jgi:DNA (cytosine-5)-methyltransferase 1
VTVGSLFAGIGGFDRGLERAGMTIKWQVEIDPWARRVLAKHWPHVHRHDDIRTAGAHNLEGVDLVCGGWPCQPFSSASRGRKRGRESADWLWPDMLRVIQEIRPYWVLGENVPHFDDGTLDVVVDDLEACGYQVAPPLEIPAGAFGHDHGRPRLWIIGHADGNREPRRPQHAEVAGVPRVGDDARGVGAADGVSGGLHGRRMKAIGNAVVPQIPEWIGRRILAVEGGAQ